TDDRCQGGVAVPTRDRAVDAESWGGKQELLLTCRHSRDLLQLSFGRLPAVLCHEPAPRLQDLTSQGEVVVLQMRVVDGSHLTPDGTTDVGLAGSLQGAAFGIPCRESPPQLTCRHREEVLL